MDQLDKTLFLQVMSVLNHHVKKLKLSHSFQKQKKKKHRHVSLQLQNVTI